MGDSLTIKAPAKINLTLRVGPRRVDGFHDIRSIMQAISLADTLTISAAKDSSKNGSGALSSSDTLNITGPDSQGLNSTDASNLVLQALSELRKRRPEMPFCHIELEKVIPLGGGLGGGSSDCASTLIGANEYFGLMLSREELMGIGASLGSDVPFFFSSGSAMVSGRGELFKPIATPSDYSLVLINPGIHISTAEAFAEWDDYRASFGGKNQQNAENTPLTSPEIGFNFSGSSDATSWWQSLEEEGSDFERLYLSGRCKAECINDFADSVRQIQDCLRQSGASFIRVSGSGSTVFGVFDATSAKNVDSERFDSMVRRGWRVFICSPISLPDISV